MKYHELQPDAGRVITSLRDSGYDFCTAVADIVDNSIAANASFVRIAAVCDSNTGEITVAIADNGSGMDIDELCNALTYGSKEREDIHSLGKYGLGLKTASTSQCRCLTLVSRKNGCVSKLVLDIDHTSQSGKWEYIETEPSRTERRYLDMAADQGNGTAVIWTKCDRLMGRSYKQPGGRTHQNAFKRKLEELRFHLGLVFQRFIDRSDRRASNVRIVLNGEAVQPYDPFAFRLGKTEVTYDEETIIGYTETSDYDAPVYVRACIVPSRDELSNQSEVDLVFPPGISPDKMQGFFVYRENRLIHFGDWCSLYKTEFHHRLCRVELSFDARLDEFFSVDFQKSKVEMDGTIKSWLIDEACPEMRRKGSERYRKGTASSISSEGVVTHSKSNKTIEKVEKADDSKLFTVKESSNGTREIKSAKGRSFIEPIPEISRSWLKTNIRTAESLPGDVLWRAGLFKDEGRSRTYVEINTSHPFYQYAYYTCKGNSNAIKCLDYLIWSLAQAEYATKDQESKENFEDMICEVSRTLRLLCRDLPQDESL